MPGTAAEKCHFTSRRYRTAGGSFVDAGLTAGDLASSDRNEWDYDYVSGTALSIWDRKPLA